MVFCGYKWDRSKRLGSDEETQMDFMTWFPYLFYPLIAFFRLAQFSFLEFYSFLETGTSVSLTTLFFRILPIPSALFAWTWWLLTWITLKFSYFLTSKLLLRFSSLLALFHMKCRMKGIRRYERTVHPRLSGSQLIRAFDRRFALYSSFMLFENISFLFSSNTRWYSSFLQATLTMDKILSRPFYYFYNTIYRPVPENYLTSVGILILICTVHTGIIIQALFGLFFNRFGYFSNKFWSFLVLRVRVLHSYLLQRIRQFHEFFS